MKKMAIFMVALHLAFVTSVNADVVGLWHLDGNADDSSGYDNHGIEEGGATYVGGVFDQALNFDGEDDYVEVGNDASLDMTNAYTIETWVNLTDVPSNKYRPILFRGTTNSNDIEVYVQANSKDLIVAHNRGNGGTFDYVGFTDPPIGTWFHLAVTFNGSDVQTYYNGASAGVAQKNTIMNTPLATGSGWWMGKVDHTAFGTLGTGNIQLFKGNMDEVRIWDKALSDSEIAASASLVDVEITKSLINIDPSLGFNDDGYPIVPMATPVSCAMDVTVSNGSLLDLWNVLVRDRMGAEWGLNSIYPENDPSILIDTKGKSEKVFIDWMIAGLLTTDDSVRIDIVATTDLNPGNHQEYTSPGIYIVNSASLGFCVTIADEEICLMKSTAQILVEAVGIEE